MAAGRARYVFTREETADGRSYTIRAAFANYDNVSDCFDAHATLLISSHYQKCMDAKTPEEYCVALQEDGYATAHNYAQSLIELINSHNLKQYDEVL